MKHILLLCAACLTSGLLHAQRLQGHFEGSLQTPQGDLPILFHFGQHGDTPTNTMDSPAQGAYGIPVQRVHYGSDGKLTIEMPQIRFRYDGVIRNDSLIEGTVTQAGQSLPLNLKRIAGKAAAASRPGTPQPPFPYREEEVSITTADSIRLAGTLVLPEGEGPFPAIVLITGSGAQNRDEEMWNYRPFFMIADALARQGFATLRMDDRGTGRSGGRHATTTLQTAAYDAGRALDYLRSRREIDTARIGLAGHSMGGTIAFRIAARRPQDVACVISLAGAATPGKEIMKTQCRKALLSLLPAEKATRLAGLYDRLYDTMASSLPLDSIRERSLPVMTDIWKDLGMFAEALHDSLPEKTRAGNARQLIRQTLSAETVSIVQYDPSDDLHRVVCPIWAAGGDKDLQVITADNLQAIRTLTQGNPHVTTRTYPGLNHLFLPSQTGLPTEYPTLKGNFSPQVLQDMTEWLRQTLL